MRNQKDQEIVSSLIVCAIFVMLVLALSGCSTAVPVTAKFPDAPGKGSMERCPDLKKLTEGVKLSGVAETVTINYSTYYECAVKADTWQEWYQIQKNIYEKAGK